MNRIILILAVIVLLPSADASSYEGMSFSFEYPSAFVITENGTETSGDISIESSCALISLKWLRDPGFAPDEILDNIIEIYEAADFADINSKRQEIRIDGNKAAIMDLSSKYLEYKSKKRYVVWISPSSDRLFLATMWSCSDSYSESIEVFDQMLESFSDLGSDEYVKLKGRSAIYDAWGVVLRDLLSSHHYRYEAIPRSVAIELSLSVSQDDELIIDEDLSIIDHDFGVRSSAVQQLLQESGYDARFIQSGGEVWLLVQGPARKWQAVSTNPEEPWTTVGVLVDEIERYRGLMYDDIAALADDNQVEIEKSKGLIEKDCDPSRYVNLDSPNEVDLPWTIELGGFLGGYRYPHEYEEDVFDCSNTSQICWAVLVENGYDAALMTSYEGHPLDPHMWVVVKHDDGYIALETASVVNSILEFAKVVEKDEYYKGIMYNSSIQYSMCYPEEGMWLMPSAG